MRMSVVVSRLAVSLRRCVERWEAASAVGGCVDLQWSLVPRGFRHRVLTNGRPRGYGGLRGTGVAATPPFEEPALRFAPQ